MSAFVYSGWIPAMTYAIVALIVILFTRGQLSYKAGGIDNAQK